MNEVHFSPTTSSNKNLILIIKNEKVTDDDQLLIRATVALAIPLMLGQLTIPSSRYSTFIVKNYKIVKSSQLKVQHFVQYHNLPSTLLCRYLY